MIQWQEIEKLYPFYKKYVGLKALCFDFEKSLTTSFNFSVSNKL